MRRLGPVLASLLSLFGCSLLLGPEPTFRNPGDGGLDPAGDAGARDADVLVDGAAPEDGGAAGSPCDPAPCLNGGSCTRTGAATFRCDCAGTGHDGPACEDPLVCDGATAPTNGRVSETSVAYPGSVTYTCDAGYVLEGDETVRCTEDGIFAGPPPRCLAACVPLTRPSFGTLDRELGGEGQVATYGCLSGRTLIGDRTRTCLPSGLWTGTAPECAACTSSRWCFEAFPLFSATGAWGVDRDEIWIADQKERIVRWDGRRLREFEAPERMSDVWGSAAADVWAVGFGGAIVRWDGTEWTSARSPVTVPLHGVAGTSPTNVWAVGAAGTAVHYDGTRWVAIATGSRATLRSVWAAALDDAWAVGTTGTLIRWDGTAWVTFDSGTRFDLTRVWGTDADHVYAVGSDPATGAGVLLRWDGSSWTAVDLGLGAIGALIGVWGRSRSDIWLGEFPSGSTPYILHWNGSIWSREAAGLFGPSIFWGDEDEVFAIGSVIARRTAAGWESIPETAELRAAWAGSSARVWAVGHPGIRTRDLDWLSQTSGPSDRRLDGVWGAGSSDVWAAGWDGMFHWDGRGWSPAAVTLGPYGLLGISGSAATNVWAVGRDGQSYQWDGATWRSRPVGTSAWLYAVWARAPDDVWAVGDGGTILRWNGTSWNSLDGGTSSWLGAVWGSAANDVWAAGAEGTLLHWDGADWVRTTLGSGRFYGLWGSAADDVWLVGESSFHWDGAAWAPVDMPFATWIYGVWGTSAADVWVVGERGTILRYRP